LPVTRARSTPSSRANARTAGVAYGTLSGMIESASNGTGGAWRDDALSSARAAAGLDGAGAAGLSALAGSAGFSGAFFSGSFCAAGALAASPPSASIVAITLPSATSSPTLTFISLIVPANGAGTSMVALADSSVTRPWSFSTRSPGLTITSITGTPWKSPMSGTFASRTSAMSASFDSKKSCKTPSFAHLAAFVMYGRPDPKVTVTTGGWQSPGFVGRLREQEAKG